MKPEQLKKFIDVANDEDLPQDLPLEMFDTADEGIRFYNGWLLSLPPPRKVLHPKYKWDPVNKWYDTYSRPVYWYVVGTGNEASFVVESAEAVRHWTSEYYTYFKMMSGEQAARDAIKLGGVPEVDPGHRDLKFTPPEGRYLVEEVGLR